MLIVCSYENIISFLVFISRYIHAYNIVDLRLTAENNWTNQKHKAKFYYAQMSSDIKYVV